MNNKKIRTSIFAIALIAFSTFLFSCKKDPVITDPGIASLRVINTVATSDPQDFYQDNTKLTKSAVGYGEYSDYVNVIGGYSVLWSNDALTNKATAVTDVILYDKSKYTLLYYENSEEKPLIAGLVNQDKTPATGMFRVRFLNISVLFNNKPLVVLGQSGSNINSDLKFGDNPVYFELAPSNEIKINIKDEDVFTIIPPATFQEGKTYLVWFDTADGITVQYHIVPQD